MLRWLLLETCRVRVSKNGQPLSHSQHLGLVILDIGHAQAELDITIDGSIFGYESSGFEPRVPIRFVCSERIAKGQAESLSLLRR